MSKTETKHAEKTTEFDEPGRHALARSDADADRLTSILSKPVGIGRSGNAGERGIDGVVIGTVENVSEEGRVEVDYLGNPAGRPLAALTTQSIDPRDVGRSVALSFVDGDARQPLVLGLIFDAGDPAPDEHQKSVNVKLDDERLVLTADREIVLRCGKSSVTLTRAGKIIVKGACVSTHSTGVNRIKGGSVQIN